MRQKKSLRNKRICRQNNLNWLEHFVVRWEMSWYGNAQTSRYFLQSAAVRGFIRGSQFFLCRRALTWCL
jgi:hypothetical protein